MKKSEAKEFIERGNNSLAWQSRTPVLLFRVDFQKPINAITRSCDDYKKVKSSQLYYLGNFVIEIRLVGNRQTSGCFCAITAG